MRTKLLLEVVLKSPHLMGLPKPKNQPISLGSHSCKEVKKLHVYMKCVFNAMFEFQTSE